MGYSSGGRPFGRGGVRWLILAVAIGTLCCAVFGLPRLSGAQTADPARDGTFSEPVAEPTIGPGAGYPRVATADACIDRKTGKAPTGPPGTSPNLPPPTGDPTGPGLTRGFIDCKPAAGSQTMLAQPGNKNPKVVYWDNLAGTENVELSILSEYGVVGLNDQSRLMDPSKLTAATADEREKAWLGDPSPIDGGAPNAEKTPPTSVSTLFTNNASKDDGSLFCSGQVLLGNGMVFATGGTKYRNDPGNDQSKFGSTELEGIPNSRIYNPKTNRWTQTGSMNKGRWYGTPITLPGAKIFEASGLAKLVKAANTTPTISPNDVPGNDPSQPQGYSPGYGVQEGQNERVTETYDQHSGRWTANPDSARKTLPLFPRLHLLPNGHVYYDAVGQAFNPLGQAYDEALWNIASSYDPVKKRWNDLGIPNQENAGSVPGFIGSTFSVMLPLKQEANGSYRKASFLVAGGVPNPPSPGGYFSIKQSSIHTVDTGDPTAPNHEKLTSKITGPLATSGPFGRWYSSGTLLPTGEVLATSGADRDEVALPGFEIPVMKAELFDPTTGKWRQVAEQHRARTYHNTANLMPDGRVLVGGHAVISNGYLADRTIVPGTTSPNGPIGRDPTFEVYSPPYMSCPGKQATIESITQLGKSGRQRLNLDVPGSSIENVVAMRYGAITHVVDADQRSVDLRIVARKGNTVTVQGPTGAQASAVLPMGPYMTFANRRVGSCLKPSHAYTEYANENGVLQARAAQVTHRRKHKAKKKKKHHRRRHASPSFTG